MADLPDVPEDAEWYTPQEIAQIFRVDPKTVARWHKRGKFEEYGVSVAFTPGGHRRYNRKDIDRVYLDLNPSLKKPEDDAA